MRFWNHLEYFEPSEFDRPELMSRTLLLKLDRARKAAGVPFRVSSSYRTDSKSHSGGGAVDIECAGSLLRYRIVKAALDVGFLRVGIYDRHVHLDVADLDQEVLWIGTSR